MANILRGVGKITNSANQTFEWELTNPTAGQGLIYQGGKWINSNIASSTNDTTSTMSSIDTTSTMSSITGVEYLVIGGGGGGGFRRAGGGGAGGYRSSVPGELSGGGGAAEPTITLDLPSYTISIGEGGAGSTSEHPPGENGQNSIFGSIVSIGGGGGSSANHPYELDAPSGGSGGGSGSKWVTTSRSGGDRIAGQGMSGGSTSGGQTTAGAGGGGAAEAGESYDGPATTTPTAGKGGDGISSLITGTSVARAGGGGGGVGLSGTPGVGGLGGGGNGARKSPNQPGSAGAVNTGGGGGGGDDAAAYSNGYSGGSGVVILAYPKESQKLPYIDGNLAYKYSVRPNDQAHVYEFIGGAGQISATEANPAFYSKELENACLFDGSGWLSWTPTQAFTNNTTYQYTLSFWVKKARNDQDQGQALFTCTNGSSGGGINFSGAGAGGGSVNDDLVWNTRNASTGTSDYVIRTKRLFRDASAWYHITLMYQSSNYTSNWYGGANRSDWNFIISVNGEELLKTSDYGSDMTYNGGANYVSNWLFGGQQEHLIGAWTADASGTSNFQGYLANIHFIDGQALDPNSFGTYREGVWIPKQYGTGDPANVQTEYGTNGFHLDFSNAGNLGKDVSGNDNDWAVN